MVSLASDSNLNRGCGHPRAHQWSSANTLFPSLITISSPPASRWHTITRSSCHFPLPRLLARGRRISRAPLLILSPSRPYAHARYRKAATARSTSVSIRARRRHFHLLSCPLNFCESGRRARAEGKRIRSFAVCSDVCHVRVAALIPSAGPRPAARLRFVVIELCAVRESIRAYGHIVQRPLTRRRIRCVRLCTP